MLIPCLRHRNHIYEVLAALVLIAGNCSLYAQGRLEQRLQANKDRLRLLASLNYEIQEYAAAKNYIELQRSLEPDKWEQAFELALTGLQDAASGAATNYEIKDKTLKYKPSEDDPMRPQWQDGDMLHLQVLLDVIRYDSKKLGLAEATIGPRNRTTIGSGPSGAQSVLQRLATRINLERDRLVPAIQQDTYAVIQTKEAASIFAEYDSIYGASRRAHAEVQRQGDIVQACMSRCLADPNTERALACEKVCEVPFNAAIAAADKADKALYAFPYTCNSDFCIINGHTTFRNP